MIFDIAAALVCLIFAVSVVWMIVASIGWKGFLFVAFCTALVTAAIARLAYWSTS